MKANSVMSAHSQVSRRPQHVSPFIIYIQMYKAIRRCIRAQARSPLNFTTTLIVTVAMLLSPFQSIHLITSAPLSIAALAVTKFSTLDGGAAKPAVNAAQIRGSMPAEQNPLKPTNGTNPRQPATVAAYFNDLSGFNSAAGSPPTSVNFDELAPGTDISGMKLSGATFQRVGNSANLLIARAADTYSPAQGWDPGYAQPNSQNKLVATSGANVLSPGGTALGPGQNASVEEDDMQVTFDNPVASVGFDVLFQSMDGNGYVGLTAYDASGAVLYSNGNIPIGGSNAGDPGAAWFVGLVSTSANISRLYIDDQDHDNANPDCNIGYDTFRFVPPPSTALQPDNLLGWDNRGCTCNTGQPVNLATGNFWHSFTDLAVPGRGIPLQFVRTYNSLVANQSSAGGYGWTNNYAMFIDSVGGLYQVHRPSGSIDRFRSDFTHEPWVEASLLRNTDGSFVLTDTRGLDTYFFKAITDTNGLAGKLYQMKDRNGYTTSLTYDANSHLLSSVTDESLRQLTFSYTLTGTMRYLTSVSTVASGITGQSVSYGYDSAGNLQTVIDVGGNYSTFSYDAGGYHELTRMNDPNGGALQNAYEAVTPPTYRVTRQVDPLGRWLDFSYSGTPDNATTRITDTLGIVNVQIYNNYKLVKTIGHANATGNQQAVTTYSYQPNTTWIAQTTDPLSNTTSYIWDNVGNLLSTTDPLNRTVSYAYNSTNDPIVITNTVNLTTSIGYDAWGNVTTITRPITETSSLITTTLGYDPAHHGDLLSVTNPLTHSWTMTHDTYGYLATASDPLNDTTTYYHNSIGWLTSLVTPRSYTTTFQYNSYGEPTVITNTRTLTTSYTYDNVGNVIRATDANFHPITYTYNLDNEVTRVTNYDGTHSDYAYDAAGRVLTQTNGLGQSTTYSYDDINRIYRATDPLLHTTSSQEDLVGNTAIITDAMGLTITLGYDNAYQLQGLTYHDGGTTPNVTYAYNTRGLRSSMTDGSGTSTYTYDSLNRPVSVQDGAGRTVGYGYDNGSRLTGITYPDMGSGTRLLSRGYDDADRLTSVTDWLTNTTRFGYNQDSAMTVMTYPVGTNLTSTFSYNEADVLTSINHNQSGTPFLLFSYGRDNVGLLQSANEGTALGNHTYSYDALYRLASDQVSASSTTTNTYTYDGATEITATTSLGSGSPVNGTRTYNAANQLQTLTEIQGGTTTRNMSFTYDNKGNRTQLYNKLTKVATNATFDQANELLSYGMYQYRYDGDGLRISKQGNSPAVTHFTWDTGVEAGLPLMLQDNSSSYIYGPGGIIVETVQGTTSSPSTSSAYYYHQDQLGSVRALSNSSGSRVNTYSYDAYGNPKPSLGSVTQPFGYAGEYTDSESGLVYLRARYYDPTTQQFLSVDPLVGATEQAYAYTGGSPANFDDPSGLYYDYLGDNHGNPGRHFALGSGLWAWPDEKAISWCLNPNCGHIPIDHTNCTLDYIHLGLCGSKDLRANALSDIGGILAGLASAGGFIASSGSGLCAAMVNPQGNRTAGNAWRDYIADTFEQNGYTVQREVYKQTPFGKRYIDIEISKNGVVMGGIEAKAGNARYRSSQRAKDAWLASQGYIVTVVRER